ncbi:hypothetical protein [Oceaniradius stylonematis]|jgi:hypothetical protein|uniref:hypothetical protein n=1 Tax=Oceaniradius stylonematis TaxID=2184161 RepID=UPI00273FB1C9|nr:hypothetical protein [Oceaniradius stylonematis]
MTARTNKALDLARIMIKQAKLLKGAGLIAEATDLANRAIAINTLGHESMRMQVQPVRIADRRR